MIYFDVYTIYANNIYNNKNTIGRKAEQKALAYFSSDYSDIKYREQRIG